MDLSFLKRGDRHRAAARIDGAEPAPIDPLVHQHPQQLDRIEAGPLRNPIDVKAWPGAAGANFRRRTPSSAPSRRWRLPG